MNGIEICELTKRFDDKLAVDNLSLEIGEGELFGLLGPNGAGKSVTIKTLCGIHELTSGSAKINGFDIRTEMGEIRRIIGVCPQEPAYFPYLSGRENIRLFGNLHGLSADVLSERTEALIDAVGLGDDADRRSGKYSGGVVRRVSLAMALVNDPKVCFLDEPTVAMDPQSRHATWDIIRGLKRGGKTVILTSHYIEEVEELADRVGVIDHGCLIALDTSRALMDQNDAENLEEVFIKLTGRRIREANGQ
jgi:ABC-2 type transport system ATP-binding protein